jgi:hypothetical protein
MGSELKSCRATIAPAMVHPRCRLGPERVDGGLELDSAESIG